MYVAAHAASGQTTGRANISALNPPPRHAKTSTAMTEVAMEAAASISGLVNHALRSPSTTMTTAVATVSRNALDVPSV